MKNATHVNVDSFRMVVCDIHRGVNVHSDVLTLVANDVIKCCVYYELKFCFVIGKL